MSGTNFIDEAEFFKLNSQNNTDENNLTSLIENLKKLHDLVTHHYEDFETLIHSYLRAGTEMFGMETGIVSQIQAGSYTVLDVVTNLEGLQKGAQFDLEDTYCREVYESKKTLAFPHVGRNEKMRQHPVYQNMKLESYLSAPIFVEGKIFGTINFTSTQVRDKGFSRHERDMMDLMAKSIGSYIEANAAKRDLHQRTDQLIETNHKMNEFIGKVAHDLRGPVAAIQSYCDLLADETDETERQQMIQQIRKASVNSVELITDLVQFSALKDKRLQMKPTHWDFAEHCMTVVDGAKKVAQQKNILIECQGDPGMIVHADRLRILQVMNNLLSNAIKFTHRGGKIVVSAQQQEDRQLQIRVSDNGVGIAENKLTDIFDRYAVFTTPGTEGELGTGFGLPVCQELLKAHGSQLNVTSKTGEGTEFSFTLPLTS